MAAPSAGGGPGEHLPAADAPAPDATPSSLLAAAAVEQSALCDLGASVPDAELEADGITPRRGSSLYTQRAYWEKRFAREVSREWLASWADVRARVRALLPPAAAPRVLLVGCGNSALAADMAADGYTRISASDYSATVIAAMRARVGDCGGRVEWRVEDMAALRAPDGSLDAVFDKAAMDAVLADGGDSWEPPPQLLATARTIMDEAHRVLRAGGLYLQLTFSQRHFRAPYLRQGAWAACALQRYAVDVGLGYNLFVLRKEGGAASADADAAAAGAAAQPQAGQTLPEAGGSGASSAMADAAAAGAAAQLPPGQPLQGAE